MMITIQLRDGHDHTAHVRAGVEALSCNLCVATAFETMKEEDTFCQHETEDNADWCLICCAESVELATPKCAVCHDEQADVIRALAAAK
jgi:hypothetical protein